jgi:tol-pal system protein YbgF
LSAAAFVACLILAGCSTTQKVEKPEAWLQDKQAVMQSIEQLQNQQKQLVDTVTSAQKQLLSQDISKQQQQAEYAALQEQIGQLKEQVSKLQSATAQLSKSRNISTQSLDKKIEKIAQAIKPAEPPDQTGAKEAEKDHYTAAYLALKSGRYDEAIQKFRDLLKSYPNGGYSDQAYYWLGESYLTQKDLVRAVANLEWLVSHYPDSTRHAAAMLSLGIAYRAQKRFNESSDILHRLIVIHSDSRAAREAQKLLQEPAPVPDNTTP